MFCYKFDQYNLFSPLVLTAMGMPNAHFEHRIVRKDKNILFVKNSLYKHIGIQTCLNLLDHSGMCFNPWQVLYQCVSANWLIVLLQTFDLMFPD